MARAPAKPSEVFDMIREDCLEAFHEGLKAIYLFGSGAGGEYVAGKSDINFLILVTPEGMKQLERLIPFLERWRKRNVAIPLVLTEEYIRTSLDSFPIEFFNIQARYHTVHGKDILSTLEINRKEMRLQCEREIKGNLLHLRQSYLVVDRDKRKLQDLISSSITPFISIFSALLFVKERKVEGGGREILRAACEEYSLDGTLFEELLQLKKGSLKLDGSQMQRKLEQYIQEVEKLTKLIDKETS
jgi:predicted nucleotidyltransferase